MKTLILGLILCFAGTAFAQSSSYTTFSAKTFAKASSRQDTSATVSVGGYPVVSIRTTSVGTDSAVITVIADGLINGVWSNLLTSAALQLGRPAAHTLASSKGQVSELVLRDQGRIADLLQNCTQIRVRNTVAAGAGDSASATSYTQSVTMRKW